MEGDLPRELLMLKDTVRRFCDRELIPLEGKAGRAGNNGAFVEKLFYTEIAWNAADMCLQIHRGMGLTSAAPGERF